MLTYFYTKEFNRLYVHDDENGYFNVYNKYTGKWEIPVLSFSVIDHDTDDLAPISEEEAKKISI